MARPVTPSLNELLLLLGQFYYDARLLRATEETGLPNEYRCDLLAYGRNNRYEGAELWCWSPPPSGHGRLFTVQSSVGETGTLVLSGNWGTGGATVGTVATIQNIGGKGKPHDQREWALKMALMQAGLVAAEATITEADSTTRWHDIPAGLCSITAVYRVRADGTRQEVGPAYWHDGVDVMGRKLYLPVSFNEDDSFLVQGRQDATYPWSGDTPDYDAPINVDPQRTIKDAVMWLAFGGRDNRSPELAANMYNDRLRTSRDHPLPNEVWLELR